MQVGRGGAGPGLVSHISIPGPFNQNHKLMNFKDERGFGKCQGHSRTNPLLRSSAQRQLVGRGGRDNDVTTIVLAVCIQASFTGPSGWATRPFSCLAGSLQRFCGQFSEVLAVQQYWLRPDLDPWTLEPTV